MFPHAAFSVLECAIGTLEMGRMQKALDVVEVRKVRLLTLGRWVCVTSFHRILEHLSCKDHLVPVAT